MAEESTARAIRMNAQADSPKPRRAAGAERMAASHAVPRNRPAHESGQRDGAGTDWDVDGHLARGEVTVALPLPRAEAEAYFAQRMRSIAQEAATLALDSLPWREMPRAGDAAALARRLIAGQSAPGQTDWRALGALNRLDLSVEFAVRDAECLGLFTDAERELARQRLAAARSQRSSQSRRRARRRRAAGMRAESGHHAGRRSWRDRS